MLSLWAEQKLVVGASGKKHHCAYSVGPHSLEVKRRSEKTFLAYAQGEQLYIGLNIQFLLYIHGMETTVFCSVAPYCAKVLSPPTW